MLKNIKILALLTLISAPIASAQAQQSPAQVARFQSRLAGNDIASNTLLTRGLGYYVGALCSRHFARPSGCLDTAVEFLEQVPPAEDYDQIAILVLELSHEICLSAPTSHQNACLLTAIDSHINVTKNSIPRREWTRVRRSHILELKKHFTRCEIGFSRSRIDILYPFGRNSRTIKSCFEDTVIPRLIHYYEVP